MPIIGDAEVKAVVEVLRYGPLTSALGEGPKVTAFEKEFAEFANVSYSIAVNTGTSALHLAIISAGVKPGDEVILPSFTFVATAEAVVMAGGKPVFVDIDPVSFNINPDKIEEKITTTTKVIMPVDLFGLPADLNPIRKIAMEHDIAIVEDAAQAHGAQYSGKPVGLLANATCWSFYASKNMTTGEGGIITTNNAEMAKFLRMLRSHGEQTKYSSLTLGYNYRMSEIQAALGLVQLDKLPYFVAKRTANAKKMTQILSKEKRLKLPYNSEVMTSGWNLYTVKLIDSTEKERDELVNKLRTKGIGATVYYVNPVHLMPFYREKFGLYNLPETEEAAKKVFSLPVHPGLQDSQIEYIAQTLLNSL